MDIELVNFRCYRKANFTLPERGLIQLAGSNGKGKTTIFNSISYALYNRLKGRPYSHGTKTCAVSVKIHSKDLLVKRCSSPNTLQVWYKDKKYEGESAQGVINNVLNMDNDEFWISSYFSHDLQGSVISMTSEKQSEFVEKLSLKNSPHREYLASCSEKISELQEEVIQQKGKCSSLKQSIKSISKLLPEAPPNVPEMEDVKSRKSELQTLLSRAQAKVEKLQLRYEKLKETESKTVEARAERDTLKLKISHYSQLISNIGGVLTEDDAAQLERDIELLEQRLHVCELLKKRKTFRKLVRDYEKDQNPVKQEIDELAELTADVDEKELVEEIKALRSEYQSRVGSEGAEKARYEDAKREISAVKKELKQMFKGAARLQKPSSFPKFISREIGKTKKRLDADSNRREKLSSRRVSSLTCPNCEISLTLADGQLDMVSSESDEEDEESVDERLMELNMSIASSEAILQNLNLLESDVKRLLPSLSKRPSSKKTPFDYSQIEEKEALLQSVRTLEERRNLLKTPPYILKAKKEIKKITKSIPDGVEPVEDSVAASEEISTMADTLERSLNAAGSLSVYKREINKLNRRLDVLEKHLGCRRVRKGEAASELETSEKVLDRLETVRVKVHQFESELLSLKKDEIAIKEYEAYVNSKKKIKGLTSKSTVANEELENLETRLEGFKGLKKSIKEAMIVAMTDTIVRINYHAAIHLEKLFDIPISFKLTGLTTTQKGKTSLKMSSNILYNGEEYQSIDEMSRGERQRCNLSFLLAVNDMIGSKFLMLDECLNSMDVSAKREVLDVLEDMGGERLILLASHEAVQGVFNNVINVDH